MPRLAPAASQKPRLRQVAVTALFATLASSSSSAFSNSVASRKSTFGFSTRGGSLSSPSTKPPTTAGVFQMSSTTVDAPGDTATSPITPTAKLEALRSKMKEYDLDVYLVPTDDPHLSGMCGIAFISPRT